MPRILQKTIGASIAVHFDEADLVDEQPWRRARRDGDIENIAIFRRLRQNRGERLRQQLQPGDFGGANIDAGG